MNVILVIHVCEQLCKIVIFIFKCRIYMDSCGFILEWYLNSALIEKLNFYIWIQQEPMKKGYDSSEKIH